MVKLKIHTNQKFVVFVSIGGRGLLLGVSVRVDDTE